MSTSKSNAKGRATSAPISGVYKPDSIRDVAESLNITSFSDAVASSLASDVEYRVHQVLEEAARFMRHARRTTLTTSDVDHALRVLNIEPLYGHSPHNPPVFRRAPPFPQLPAAGSVYFVEDEEIDFDRVLREEKLTLPKGVSWTAHWLAVEGVQPLIPENPPAIPKDTDQDFVMAKSTSSPLRPGTVFPPSPPSSDRPSPMHTVTKQQQQLVKHVLSRELQLYYTRLTSALLPPSASDYAKRTAALASLRHDAGLQALLPYLVRWVGEGAVSALKGGVQSETDGRVLEVLLDVIGALLDNSTLFVEPYLHQLLPPILSILLHSALPPSHAAELRTSASQILSHLLTHYSTTYPSLPPRIMKTLLLALISPGKSRGTREGAIRGLMGVGKEAVRKGLVDGGGAKVVGSECFEGESSPVVECALDALKMLHPPSTMSTPLDASSETDVRAVTQLREVLGDFFANKLVDDSEWARGILSADQKS
ncbi:Transcription initiation factor TFIID subunit 6 [Sparassis crispa]|uniref:TBP-associated factor 6 n=1 Tax=Sparassis crispa TaxID=139825 RepID=A0A401GNE3_9APHY|nr:Transcription initiation factor TFIID subunit 6 [Sparassis crispa]GBE83264.1 Transcription initiation factor TFIID subunit 6 [Sparassis crispa]